MATGTRTEHQNERVSTEVTYPVHLFARSPALSGASQVYLVSPVKGNITNVYSVVNTALTVAKSTLTVKAPDGTVGSFEIAHLAAIGTTDNLADQATLANTEVEAGEAIEIENDAAPGQGNADYVVVIGP